MIVNKNDFASLVVNNKLFTKNKRRQKFTKIKLIIFGSLVTQNFHYILCFQFYVMLSNFYICKEN